MTSHPKGRAMRLHRHIRRSATLAVATGLLAAGAAPAAQAAVPDPERNATTPTGWHWYYGLSAEQVKQRYAAHGDRIVDLEVQSTAPHRFNVATVRNSGVYARGWYWYYGLTAAQVKDRLKQKKGRLIDLETYTTGGVRRFAVVMVVNKGQAAKNWHWYHGQSADQLKARLSQHKSRLIDLESYSQGGSTKYAAIMIRNSGVDKSAWWFWRNVPLSTVQNSASANGARTFSIDRLPNGRYNAIQIKRKGEFSAYEINVDARRAGDFISQNGGRIVDVDTYVVAGKRRFTVVINDNADAFNARVRSAARASSKLRAARFGMFVREVGGAASVRLGADRVFEPASVMKTLHHLYLHSRLEANPPENLNAIVAYPDCPAVNPIGECNVGKAPKDVCPTRAGVSATSFTTLDNADRWMMANSDNRTTFAIEQRYGRAAINAYAGAIGATRTQINQNVGCWGPDNEITLDDLSRMIEGAHDGSLLPTQAVRQRFFDTLIQGSSISAALQALVAEEAALAGKAGIEGQFVAAMLNRAKGGSYGSGQRAVRANFGRMLIPFKVGGRVQQRAFSYGNFYNCEDCSGDAATATAYANAATEQFRAAIRSAIATW
ncbi:MAG TPA: serine hydrolase [Solirubrobacteraceae bacterium]|nr:serine hydrolase [Solirubrobacteraceae bacterium]